MLISDLTYTEVISEDTMIEGGWTRPCLPFPKPCINIKGDITATGNVEYFGLGISVDPCIKGFNAKSEGGASAVGSATYTFESHNAMADASKYSSMSSGIAVASALG
ncbi:MAG TPA: hypothetical protein V6C57_19130 [Coleofasciculaceae cyanobacterium]